MGGVRHLALCPKPRTHGADALIVSAFSTTLQCDWEGVRRRMQEAETGGKWIWEQLPSTGATGLSQVAASWLGRTNNTPTIGPSEPNASYWRSLVNWIILGCPEPHKPWELHNSSYIDIRASKWAFLAVPETGRTGFLVKRTGRGDTACLSINGRECVEMSDTCVAEWLPRFQFQATTPFLNCWELAGHDSPDHWCARAKAIVADLAMDFDALYGIVPQGDSVVGDNCTFNRNNLASNFPTANESSVDPSAAGPWTVSSYAPYAFAVLRKTVDNRIGCVGFHWELKKDAPPGCVTFSDKVCAENFAKTTPATALEGIAKNSGYLVQNGFIDTGSIDKVANEIGLVLEPWTCVRFNCYVDPLSTFGTYIMIRRYGKGGMVLIGPSMNYAAVYDESTCRKLIHDTAASVNLTCANPRDCPQLMATLDGNLPSLIVDKNSLPWSCPPPFQNQTTCAWGPWACIKIPEDKSNFVMARLGCNGTVQCLGPDVSKCSWFSRPYCDVVAPGEFEPDASSKVGMVCDEVDRGWCKTAHDALTRNGTIVRPACCAAAASPLSATATSSGTSGPAETTAVKVEATTKQVPSAAPDGRLTVSVLLQRLLVYLVLFL